MTITIDSEFITGGAYCLIAILYLLLWRSHNRHCHAALAGVAIILAMSAFLRSEAVRTRFLSPAHQSVIPSRDLVPGGDFMLIAGPLSR